MAKALEGVADVWRKAGLVQRVLLLAVILSCIAAAALLVNWARKPHMSLLFSGLSPEDAVKLVDKIRDADVPYELKSGGTAIYVPEDKVYSMRLTAASQGLPTGDQAGYSILDDEKLGTSPFTQRINYRRALEGELARTIQMLEGVVSARVHVARPEPSLFAAREKDASATVAVRLKAGHRLSASNVAAIVHLVAGSIEGLLADNVVVVDTQGNLLSSQSDTELAKGTSSFLDYKTRLESYLARKAEDMLAAVLGPDRASVRVDATVETSSLSETTTTYLPDGTVPAKEEEKIKSATPPAGAGAAAARTGVTKESSMSTEYLVSQKTEQRTDLPGKITSLSVAALVDLSPTQEGTEGGAPPKPKITQDDVKAIICKATGVAEADVEVVDAVFERPAPAGEEGEPAGPGNWDFYLAIAKRCSLGILVIGALLLLKMFGGAKKRAAALALEGHGAAAAGALGVREVEPNAELMRARITQALQKNPEEVRRLFLTWVESEEGEA